MTIDLTELFCNIDDFVNQLRPSNLLITHSKGKRGFPPRMSLSEMMTLIIYYHSSGYKNFKSFYINAQTALRSEFPSILSYSRFIEWIPYCLPTLCSYLKSRYGKCTGISFIDSTSIKVCHNRRIYRNKVFKLRAERGKSSMGWFYGFKLHLVVNERGELLNCQVTAGNIDDRKPVPALARGLRGKLFGDKGYLSKKLFHHLWSQGVQLITNIRSNMKNKLLVI